MGFRLALLMVILLSAFPSAAQAVPWGSLPGTDSRVQPQRMTLSKAQRTNLRRLLLSRESRDVPDCAAPGESPDWERRVSLSRVHLGPGPATLVEVSAGCARGGQGSNGAMWLIAWKGESPRLLASPSEGFEGWFYGALRPVSHGLHDVVVGWHMSAFESGLAWFRFDGRRYRSVGGAIEYARDDVGQERMAVEQKRCTTDEHPCTLLTRKDSFLLIRH